MQGRIASVPAFYEWGYVHYKIAGRWYASEQPLKNYDVGKYESPVMFSNCIVLLQV